MKAPALLLTALVALAVAVPAGARPTNVTDPDLPRSVPAGGGAVSVSWTDPAQFSEIRYSGNRWESARGTWVTQLATYLRDEAGQHLARGQTLAITISDIDRAGRYEPTARIGMNDIRVVKDLYPPRMTLTFSLKGADGSVVAEGERKLVDHGFLMGSNLSSNDSLRYEKRLVDDWLRKEFRDSQALTSAP
ncbi:MAG: DUF3016 domain-containing protein [Xanthomonas sp.]|uniref:DUF3016 domain-containing protein n=1 Tax=Pseudoxanthomonas mexicana TaxID=128785 RepID=UPI0007839488|nr:DUF3016 domain-containing protein [Pseudoxanthomonas mexicana]MBA3929994.1 DUF3016 domain-containing protein [Xanthomonas sp.]MBL8256089.1 DUF3016 domain-containing protein [Pseudoxanthomonas mexicana]